MLGTIFSSIGRFFKFIGKVLLTILLLPYYIIKFLFIGVWKLIALLLPEFYAEDLKFSFKLLLSMFAILFLGLSFLLITFLTPLYLLSLLGAQGIFPKFLYEFDLLQALLVMVATLLTTEVIFFVLSLLGFLVLLIAAVAFISVYSPVKAISEHSGEITESKTVLILSFGIAVIVFLIVYLIATQLVLI